MTDLVTGEAVVLDLRLAKLASRALAISIDITVQLAVMVAGTLVIAGTVTFVDDALAAAIGLVFYLSIVLGYPVAFETLTRGRSLGKMALGLRVVREDGGPEQFRQAFVRGLLGVVEIWLTFGVVALIASLASAQGRRLGDYLAGTVVVHERVPVRAAPVAEMPPALAGWAATLDLTRVPDDLALAARQYLSRAPELAPQVRDEMGASLARALAQVTTPAPPRGVPAWAFLAAVLAERRRRELDRLAATPRPAQPYPAQPFPAQPYPAQPYPVQPYPQSAPPPYTAPAPAPSAPPAPPPPDVEPPGGDDVRPFAPPS